jgi:formate dehydrogenase subunit delta
MNIDTLVRMANQIAGFFHPYPHDEAVSQTKTHLKNFWDPRMRRDLLAHLAKGGEGLSPIALEAARALESETKPA